MKGYKVFRPDWTCRGKQYTCPGKFEEDVAPLPCECGMHFCKKIVDCFNYYSFDPDNRVAEVIAYGDIVEKGDKCCTNKLEIVREIPWTEVLELVNVGKACTGRCNTGDCNTGDCNTGDCNTGNRNTGNRNTGNRNTGNRNTGDWNKASFSNGCFNTIEPKIYLFNKPSEWTYRDWLNSEARRLMNLIPGNVLEYRYWSQMTDEEKAAHPEAETTGGYLKELDNSECGAIWWRNLNEEQKAVIMSIPNFDKAIFKEITGVDVDARG